MEKEYNSLPIIDIVNNKFFDLDSNHNKQKINNLIDKHIIFELKVDSNGITIFVGKLLDFKNNNLLIRFYDDGTNAIDESFVGWEEEVSLNNIRGIEEYKKYYPNLKFNEGFIGNICELTNKNEDKTIGLITSFDNYEIGFEYKYLENNILYIAQNYYHFYLLKDIKLLDNSDN